MKSVVACIKKGQKHEGGVATGWAGGALCRLLSESMSVREHRGHHRFWWRAGERRNESIQYFKMTSFVSHLSPDFRTSNFFSCACGRCSCVKLCFFRAISLMFFALSSPLKNFSSFSLHRSLFSVSVGLALYNFVVGIFVEFELWECVVASP